MDVVTSEGKLHPPSFTWFPVDTRALLASAYWSGLQSWLGLLWLRALIRDEHSLWPLSRLFARIQ